MDRATMAVFTGNANPQLAQEIARHLMVPLGRASVSRFSDSEVHGRAAGKRARSRRVHRAADLFAGQRSLDGIAGDDRCLPRALRPLASPP